MSVTIRTLFVLILVACAVALVAVAVSLGAPESKSERHFLIKYPEALPLDVLLPPCPTEDSNNCYWDAQTMGNGEGTDSVVLVP